jgi:hypothetical protein
MNESELVERARLSSRLAKASEELRSLERMLASGNVDVQVLADFREAVNHVRHSAWTVQLSMDLKAQNRDTFGILSLITDERVRITTNLASALVQDLEGKDLCHSTPGLGKLFENVKRLFETLKNIFG